MSTTTFDDVPLTGWLRSVGEAFGEMYRQHPALCKGLVREGLAETAAPRSQPFQNVQELERAPPPGSMAHRRQEAKGCASADETDLLPETEMSPARASVLLATIWLGGKDTLAPLFDDNDDDVGPEELIVRVSFEALRRQSRALLVDEQEPPRLRRELGKVERELARRAASAPEREETDGTSSDVSPATQTKHPPPHPASIALAILFEEPDIPANELAKRVGVAAGTVYKKNKPWKPVRDTLIARSNRSADAPGGSKDQDGNMEAWDHSQREFGGEA